MWVLLTIREHVSILERSQNCPEKEVLFSMIVNIALNGPASSTLTSLGIKIPCTEYGQGSKPWVHMLLHADFHQIFVNFQIGILPSRGGESLEGQGGDL